MMSEAITPVELRGKGKDLFLVDWTAGYSMYNRSIAGHPALWDGGGFDGYMGYNNSRFYLTDTDVTIIMLSNLGSASLTGLSELIVGELHPEN
jgi:hypothetical protein